MRGASMGGDTVVSVGTYTVKAGYVDVTDTTLLPSMEVPSKVTRGGGGGGGGGAARVSELVDGAEVKDWDGLEAVMRYILYEQLGWIEGEEGNVLMTEAFGVSRVRAAARAPARAPARIGPRTACAVVALTFVQSGGAPLTSSPPRGHHGRRTSRSA